MDGRSERERASSIGSEHGLELEEEEELRQEKATRRRTKSSEKRTADEKARDAHAKMNIMYRRVFHRDANIKKLVTFEDPYHIHKGFGILSVCSFIYRYGYCYSRTGTLGFSGDMNNVFDWATMAIHLCLAFSSKIFRVPAKRLPDKPLVIYEEYRQHAMVFTLRCFSVYCCAVLGYKGWLDQYSGVALVVAAHHMLADDITRRHGSGVTAVRANTDKASDFYKKVGLLYSFYQFLAIASHIIPAKDEKVLAELGYNAIIAIASSAFMMTLYRKRIIRALAHMFIYSFCLAVSTFHICRHIGWHATFLTACAFALRINLPRAWGNKYVIWTLFMLAFSYQNELGISEAHLEPVFAPVFGTCNAAYDATVTPVVGMASDAVVPILDQLTALVKSAF